MHVCTRLALFAVVCGLAAFPAPRASACGGFFCSSSPIVQARESVVYGLEEDGSLTMAVQIQYAGRDEDFAWILPVPVPPDEIALGTDALFDQLAAATEPQFQLERRTEGTCSTARCSYPSYGGGFGCASAGGVPRLEDGYDPSATGADAGSVVVHAEGVVGPYDTVVIGAATADEVVDWLTARGYDIPDASRPLLAPYADQGFVFVALRLNANAESSVIRPIVMRMPTNEACLPIRLTAIASTPDLPIALYFLGSAQVAARNYSVADVAATPDLFLGATSWSAEVAERVRALGGQAFATDYADETPGVSLTLPAVLDLAGSTDPGEFLSELQTRGYTGTQLLLDLFTRYLRPPTGLSPADYVNCLTRSSTRDCGEPLSFDAPGLATAIDEAFVQPGNAAQALVDRHPYLTRLSTSMAPEDMTVDPVFAIEAGLPDVPQVRQATLVTQCSEAYFEGYAPTVIELGGEVLPVSEGRPLTEEAACRLSGGTVDTGGCSTTAAEPAPSMLLVLGAVAAFAFRKRRRG